MQAIQMYRLAYLLCAVALLIAFFIERRQRMWKISLKNACSQTERLGGIPFARFCETLYDYSVPLIGVRYQMCWPGWVYKGDCDK